MSFDEYLARHQNKLFGYFIMESLFPGKHSIDTPYPPEDLSELELEKLMDLLRTGMPRDSIVLDLWDWDIHFEYDLTDDWLYDAIFGDEYCLNDSAEQLSKFFLEKIDEYNMDYDQAQYDEDFTFEAWIRDRALDFIVQWRKNMFAQYAQHKSAI